MKIIIILLTALMLVSCNSIEEFERRMAWRCEVEMWNRDSIKSAQAAREGIDSIVAVLLPPDPVRARGGLTDSSSYWKTRYEEILQKYSRLCAEGYAGMISAQAHASECLRGWEREVVRRKELEHELQIAAAELTILRKRPTWEESELLKSFYRTHLHHLLNKEWCNFCPDFLVDMGLKQSFYENSPNTPLDGK